MSEERYHCTICGAYGVNRRTCPVRDRDIDLSDYQIEQARRDHERLTQPKQINHSQPSQTGWGSLVPETGQRVIEVEVMEPESHYAHHDPTSDELMPIQVAVNEMAKDLRDIREIIEALICALI